MKTLKSLRELTPLSVKTYRSTLRQLWIREQARIASGEDVEKRIRLEKLLGLKASRVPSQGRPRKVKP